MATAWDGSMCAHMCIHVHTHRYTLICTGGLTGGFKSNKLFGKESLGMHLFHPFHKTSKHSFLYHSVVWVRLMRLSLSSLFSPKFLQTNKLGHGPSHPCLGGWTSFWRLKTERCHWRVISREMFMIRICF